MHRDMRETGRHRVLCLVMVPQGDLEVQQLIYVCVHNHWGKFQDAQFFILWVIVNLSFFHKQSSESV